MKRPSLSWIPVRLMDAILVDRTLGVEDWLRSAPGFGLSAVEIYERFLDLGDLNLASVLAATKLSVSMITCSPDFTNPDEWARQEALARMTARVESAVELGAGQVRVTAGMRHPGVDDGQAMEWAVDALVRLSDYATPRGVVLALENHYQDRYWDQPDFDCEGEVFLRIVDRLRGTPVMVNFDASNPLMVGDDPIALLGRVVDRVVSIHASDRPRGRYRHSIIGEGMVDYDGILSLLAAHGFSGWISVEDGHDQGDDGFRRSLAFLRDRIAHHWPDSSG
jgi:sugar phosphate isomerase/epimerase